MNLFGKILIMLNLLMSLVFMGFAVAVYSTHKNWKEVITRDEAKAREKNLPLGLTIQLAKLKEQNDKLQKSYLDLQTEIEQETKMRDARLAVLETEKANLDAMVAAKAQEIVDVTQDKNVTSAAIAALTTDTDKKSDEIKTLSNEIEDKRKEIQVLYDQVLEATDKLAKAQAALDKANVQNKTLTQTVAETVAALKRLGVENISTVSRVAAPPPQIFGYVRASTPDGLVEVSVGSDDGLMRGHTMEVYREGANANSSKYLGKIEILSTEADVAVGKVLQEYRRGNIEKDDRVATRFN